MSTNELGKRMKEHYENRSKTYFPRRTYTIIRLDGKNFRSYTRGLEKPCDREFLESMRTTATTLCKAVPGARAGYVQSDEISIVLTDFDKTTTGAWLDGNVQKIVSITASMATAEFNRHRSGTALFDARAFTVPDRVEVYNYLVWRQKDAVRNAHNMIAQSLFPVAELTGKNLRQMDAMIEDQAPGTLSHLEATTPDFISGTLLRRVTRRKEVLFGQPPVLATALRAEWDVRRAPMLTTPEGLTLFAEAVPALPDLTVGAPS